MQEEGEPKAESSRDARPLGCCSRLKISLTEKGVLVTGLGNMVDAAAEPRPVPPASAGFRRAPRRPSAQPWLVVWRQVGRRDPEEEEGHCPWGAFSLVSPGARAREGQLVRPT